jgi:hypothetical protein
MLLNGENELFLRIDSLPYDDNVIYLTHLKNDRHGMKMTGNFPNLWEYGNKIAGPNLYDEKYTYLVVGGVWIIMISIFGWNKFKNLTLN